MPYADPEKKRANDRERWLRSQGTTEYRANQRARSKRYREAHPERQLEAQRKWREAHPGWWRKYQGTPSAKAYQQEWNVAHREGRRLQARARYQANPEKPRLWAMTHWSRKRNAEQGPIDVEAITLRDGGRCQICGKRVAARDRSLDHIVPLSKGGAHRQDNLQLAHLICNKRRGAGRIAAQLPLPL